jgi:hypothetical protein
VESIAMKKPPTQKQFLEPLTGPPRSRDVFSLDIESKDEDTQRRGFTRPFLVGFCDPYRYREDFCDSILQFRNAPEVAHLPWRERALAPGGCIDQLMRHILGHGKYYQGANIYAHNGGAFDFLHILPWLAAHGDEFAWEILTVSSSIQKLEVWKKASKKKHGSWRFLDSVRLLPMTLDKAAKAFLGERKTAHDLDMHESDPRWEIYNRADVRQLAEICMKAADYIEELGGEVGVTAPATAMKLYRRRFLGKGKAPEVLHRSLHFSACHTAERPDIWWEEEPLGSCPGCMHEWVRRAFYGGRTEVFERAGSGLKCFDVNSSYPFAMTFRMPCGEARECPGSVAIRMLERLAKNHIGFVECEVEIPDTCEIPPLPVRSSEHGGKLVFPTGRFSGVWGWDELALLAHPLVGGRITKIVRSVWYQAAPCFVDYVEVLYQYRDKSRDDYDEGLSELAKLLMNALFGKTAMNPIRTKIIHLAEEDEPPVGAVAMTEDDDCRTFKVSERTDAPYIAPQLAAHITTLGRVTLWRIMADVRERGGKVYYCDSDSVFADVDLPTGTKLGELKAEYDGATLRGTFISPKLYMVEREDVAALAAENARLEASGKPAKPAWKFAAKGIPKDAQTRENFERLRTGEAIHFERLEKIGGLAHRGFAGPPELVKVSKRALSTVPGATSHEKRAFAADGSSRPVRLDKPSTHSAPIERWEDVERFPFEVRRQRKKRPVAAE